MKVEDGVKIDQVKYPVYSDLERTLARRTSDESGDYTVTPFSLQLVDHQGITGRVSNTDVTTASVNLKGEGTDFLNQVKVGDIIRISSNTAQTATISAVTSANTLTTDTALQVQNGNTVISFENKFSAGLDPGKAYVKGYEYESIGVEYVDVKKGRGTTTTTSLPINPNMGNSLKVTAVDFGATTNGNVFDPSNLSQTYDLHSVSKSDIDATNQNKYNWHT